MPLCTEPLIRFVCKLSFRGVPAWHAALEPWELREAVTAASCCPAHEPWECGDRLRPVMRPSHERSDARFLQGIEIIGRSCRLVRCRPARGILSLEIPLILNFAWHDSVRSLGNCGNVLNDAFT